MVELVPLAFEVSLLRSWWRRWLLVIPLTQRVCTGFAALDWRLSYAEEHAVLHYERTESPWHAVSMNFVHDVRYERNRAPNSDSCFGEACMHSRNGVVIPAC